MATDGRREAHSCRAVNRMTVSALVTSANAHAVNQSAASNYCILARRLVPFFGPLSGFLENGRVDEHFANKYPGAAAADPKTEEQSKLKAPNLRLRKAPAIIVVSIRLRLHSLMGFNNLVL